MSLLLREAGAAREKLERQLESLLPSIRRYNVVRAQSLCPEVALEPRDNGLLKEILTAGLWVFRQAFVEAFLDRVGNKARCAEIDFAALETNERAAAFFELLRAYANLFTDSHNRRHANILERFAEMSKKLGTEIVVQGDTAELVIQDDAADLVISK